MDSICARSAFFASVLLIAGCYHPSPYRGWQGQQQYMAPQPGYIQSPGTLVIPQSDAPLNAPGSSTNTYDESYAPEQQDGFKNESNGSYYGQDGNDPVPAPRDPGSGSDMFDSEFRGN